MAIISHNLELYGYSYDNKELQWGGSGYDHFIGKEYPDEESSWVEYSDGDSVLEFIFFDTIKQTYYIDGTITGHIKIYNSSGTTYAIGNCGIYLKKRDKIGNETNLGGTMYDFDGNILADSEQYLTLPFKYEMQETEIAPQEKLILCVYVAVVPGGQLSDIKILHGVDTKYGYDLFIRLPLTLTV